MKTSAAMTRTRFPAYAVTGSERAAGSGPWCGIGDRGQLPRAARLFPEPGQGYELSNDL